MGLRRLFLSLVLAGGSLWCLGLVRQVHSEEKTAGATEKYAPVASLSLITRTQEEEFAEMKKSAAGESPKFKDVQSRANYIAELFNVAQYVEKADAKSAAAGRDQALELAKAAKAKDKDGVNKLLSSVEDAIKKTSKPAENAAAATGAYKPVSPVKPLMEAQQDFYDGMKKSLDTAKPEDLKKIQDAATMLGELLNVNSHQKPDKADFTNWATQGRDQALQLAKAAAAKDVDGCKSGLRQIHATCGACHDKYQ